MDNSLIKRQDAIDAVTDGMCSGCWCDILDRLKAVPSAQPTYTDEQIQKMQDLEQVQIQTAYEIGKAERKTGRWILYENQRQEDVDNGNYLYICSECGKSDIHAKTQDVPFCWWCGAKMEVEHE